MTMWSTILTVLQQSWQHLELQLLSVAPNVLASVFILLTGALVGCLAARMGRGALARAQFDRHAARLGITAWLEARHAPRPAALVAWGVKWGIVLIAGGLALYSLVPLAVSELTYRFLLYAPD